MSKNLEELKKASDDVVNALLADRASQRGSTRRKTSASSRRKPKSSATSTKPTKEAGQKLKGVPKERDFTNGDNRLREFLLGSRSTQIEGEEHWYDSEAGRQYTLEEIGQIMGVSRERIRQIEEVALRRMWRLLDIMSKRENLTKDDWFKDINDAAGGEAEHLLGPA